MRTLLSALALVTLAAIAPATAQAVTLTFDAADACAAACVNGGSIQQSYGDIAGQLDVQYSLDINEAPAPLGWWQTDYANLDAVVIGKLSAQAEIFLKPLPGYRVTLHGFDLGSYFGASRQSMILVRGGASIDLYETTGEFLIDGPTATHYAYDVTRSDGIRIIWGPDAYDVGLDNLSFEVSAAPEPGTWAMMILGVCGIGAMLRRRSEPEAVAV